MAASERGARKAGQAASWATNHEGKHALGVIVGRSRKRPSPDGAEFPYVLATLRNESATRPVQSRAR